MAGAVPHLVHLQELDMKKEETYRRLMTCPNCLAIQELAILKGMLRKDYVIPPKLLCTNCGCGLDGKVAPEPKPEPEPETAFQVAARACVCGYLGEIWATAPWEEVETLDLIRSLRTFYNATLDLAFVTIVCGPCAERVDKLKEPTP